MAQCQHANRDDYYDQDALTRVLIEAFDGLHPFKSSLVSERIYNSEHDDDEQWLKDLTMYQPKIIHFKGRRFRQPLLTEAVFSRLSR